MHLRHCVTILTLGWLSSLPAQAAPGYLDLAYVDSEIQADDPNLRDASLEGDGFLARVLMSVGRTAVLTVDYQDVSYDQADLDLSLLRAGPGMRLRVIDNITAMARVEYLRSTATTPSFERIDDGLGIAGSVHVDMNNPLSAWVQSSYAEFDDSDITELEIGVDLRISEVTAFFISYRAFDLDSHAADSTDLEVDEFRAGIRLWYDAE